MLFPVFAHLFGRNIGETPASCLKSSTDVIPILFQLRIFVAVFSLVHAVSIILLICIYLFSLAYNKRVILITSAEREVKDSRRSGMYQSCIFLTRLGKQSL